MFVGWLVGSFVKSWLLAPSNMVRGLWYHCQACSSTLLACWATWQRLSPTSAFYFEIVNSHCGFWTTLIHKNVCTIRHLLGFSFTLWQRFHKSGTPVQWTDLLLLEVVQLDSRPGSIMVLGPVSSWCPGLSTRALLAHSSQTYEVMCSSPFPGLNPRFQVLSHVSNMMDYGLHLLHKLPLPYWFLHQYQIILTGNRGTMEWTTCPGLVLDSEEPMMQLHCRYHDDGNGDWCC